MCLTATAGALCHWSNIAAPLERLSYDLPFPLRANPPSKALALVFLDEDAARALGQPLDAPWDRRLFARLLDRLHRDGARTVCFDLIFSGRSADPQADEEFARSIHTYGGVILGGDYREHEQFGAHVSTVGKAISELRQAEAGWGLLMLRPIDPDGAVRQLCTGYSGYPSIAWTAAVQDGAPLPPSPPENGPIYWLNYYAPAGEGFEGVSIADALRADGVPPGFFTGRTVFVGGRYSTGSLTTSKDEFGNPYSRWGRRFSPGVEVHATAYLNLLHSDFLRRLKPGAEWALLLAIGLGFGGGLCLLSPVWAAIVVIVSGAVMAAGACISVWNGHTWIAWVVPVGVELPLALAWSVGSQYFVERRRRLALRQAFSYYLSPEMADEIANSRFDLTPGGKMVEGSIMFTDLEGFSALSETVTPQQLSEVLISYFSQTTNHILENKGTIIKYIGDAVMATWGAPLPDSDHAEHAVRAAWLLGEASKQEVCGHQLRTRIGINTGFSLAGNLGSPFRFDYTLIGETTNFASRLEGMNKFLGTQILLSESTLGQLRGQYATRFIGRFVGKGMAKPVAVYELLGPAAAGAIPDHPWSEVFERGLLEYQAGRFDDAATLMHQTISHRGGYDGPAEFYLRLIEKAEHSTPRDGIVRLDEK